MPDELLKPFFQSLRDEPLNATDPRYVPLYRDPVSDPVGQLADTISWSEVESIQLFSGFRGTGKSTELRRLQWTLQQRGYHVAFCDMRDYLNLSTPIDVSDFLITVAAALGEALAADKHLLGESVVTEGYWTRFVAFMTRTEVSLQDVGVSTRALPLVVEGAAIKLGLKADPTFRQVLQERMKGHLGELVADVHRFAEECVQAVRRVHGPNAQLVLLLDNIEQIQGVAVNASDVIASVDTLFCGYASELRLPGIHVVYTAPPWLKIRAQGLGVRYNGHVLLPCVKVADESGAPQSTGLDLLAEVLEKRGDWRRVFGGRESLDRLILASGGHIRDLFALVRRCLLGAQYAGVPVSDDLLEVALADLRNAYWPVSHADALWLDRVATSGDAELPAGTELATLARFFDTHLLLCYRNGREWFGVHPIIAQEVRELAARVRPTA